MKNLLILFIAFTVISCGKISPKGNIESKDVPLEEFVNLNLKGKFRLFYIKSDSSFVNVETYPNILNNLKIKVKDKTLNIEEKRETKGVDFYNITVYSKYNLEQISITDSVEMNISSEIKTDNFRLNLKNNGKFIGSVNSRRTEVEMTGKSRANFLGTTQDAVIKIADTSSIIAPFWMIENLEIDSKNGIYAEVNVKDSLKGSIKNTSKMVYYNDPIRAFTIDKTANVQNKKME
ncbi:MAG: GIN domain-containing protein [Kaistella sp.]